MESNQPAENRWNQIDRYVSGDMVEEERNLFEERMREHAGLAQQVHLHRDILVGMEYHFAQQLKEQLALSDQPQKKFNVRRLLQIAAAVLVVAGLAGAVYYYLLQPVDPQQAALSYFEAYPNTLTQVSRSEPQEEVATSDQIQGAMQHYEAGNFSRAVVALDRLLASDSVPQRTALTFYRGVAQLGANNPTAAIADLRPIAQPPDTLLAEPATWYLGLSYLRAGQTAEAKKIFTQLRDAQGDYAERAAKLLDDLS